MTFVPLEIQALYSPFSYFLSLCIMLKELESKNTFMFSWKIENFSCCSLQNGEDLNSPEFTANNLNGTKWHLTLQPRGLNSLNPDYSACYLYRIDNLNAIPLINLDVELEALMESEEILGYYKIENFPFKIGTHRGTHQLFQNAEMLNTEIPNNSFITIRCLMKSDDAGYFAECVAQTKINVDCCFFKWHLDNFNYFTSSKRCFFCVDRYEIEISTTDSNVDFKIIISKVDQTYQEVGVTVCRLGVLNTEGGEGISNRSSHLFDDLQDWEFPSFLKKSVLTAEKNKYLKNDSFTLFCDISSTNGRISNKVDYVQCDSFRNSDSFLSKDPVLALTDDFLSLLNCQKQSDLKLQANGETFAAHTLVLSARSPIFCAMFEQNMLENQTGVVKIPDIDAKTLKSFLCFLYSGKVDDMDDETALKLLLAAEKYQVLSLKEKCSSFLVSALSNKNVCDILTVADMIGHTRLKISAVAYIKAYASYILPSPEWIECVTKNAHLVKDIFQLSPQIKKKCME